MQSVSGLVFGLALNLQWHGIKDMKARTKCILVLSNEVDCDIAKRDVRWTLLDCNKQRMGGPEEVSRRRYDSLREKRVDVVLRLSYWTCQQSVM